MRKLAQEHAVQDGSEKGPEDRDQHRSVSCSQGNEQGTRAGTGEGPSHTEQGSPEEIAFPAGFISMDVQRFPPECAPFPGPCKEVEGNAQPHGGSDDAIHVKRVEKEHLLDAEPTDDLSHREGDAE